MHSNHVQTQQRGLSPQLPVRQQNEPEAAASDAALWSLHIPKPWCCTYMVWHHKSPAVQLLQHLWQLAGPMVPLPVFSADHLHPVPGINTNYWSEQPEAAELLYQLVVSICICDMQSTLTARLRLQNLKGKTEDMLVKDFHR